MVNTLIRQYIFLLICLISPLASVLAQENSSIRQKAEELDWLILSGEAVRAFQISDSILSGLNNKEVPPQYYQIVYYKGKSLEYNLQFVESMEIILDLLPKCKEAKQYELEVKIYFTLIRIYDNLKRKEECLNYLNKANDLIEKQNLNHLRSEYSVRYASYQRYFGEMDSCFYYATKGVEYAHKYNNLKALPDSYLLLGLSEKDKKTKLVYLKKAAALYSSMNNYLAAAWQYLNVAKTYDQLNDQVDTKNYLDSVNYCIRILDQRGQAKNIRNELMYRYQRILGQHYYTTGNLDSAAFYLNKSSFTRDEVEINTIKENVAKYEIDIAVLKEREEKSQLQVFSNYLIFGLIAVTLIALLMWYFLRKNTKSNEIIKRKNDVILDQNKELEKLFLLQKKLLSEVHHRVKNNLQLVISLMTIKGNSYGNDIFKEAMDDISSKVQSMALIHEQLYMVGEFSTIHMFTYLQNIVNYYKDILRDDRAIEINLNIDEEIKLNLETTLPLGIIIVELLQNSIKHAKPASGHLQIQINLHPSAEAYIFEYSDNGTHYLSEKKGLGTMLIENMGRQLNGESSFTLENGFYYSLNFKEKLVSPINLDYR